MLDLAPPLALQWLEKLEMGGYTMIPLLAASVLLVAIVLERLAMLRRGRVVPASLVRLIEAMGAGDSAEGIGAEAARLDAPLARIIRAGLEHAGDGRASVVLAMTQAGKEEARALEQGLGIIDTIAVAAPLLGLLGTLLGMTKVFFGIQQQVSSSMTAVSPGIAEALLTTIVGLIIAIPSLVFYNYLSRRVDGLVLALEKHASAFVAKLYTSDHGPNEAGGSAEWSFTGHRGGGRS